MVSKPQAPNESVKLAGGDLGDLSFEWKEDRYAHVWNIADTSVRSVESDSLQLWPVSPPLQQIHQQSFGDGREIIFGVGMSGRGHWSASFTLVPELKCWIVELACRAPIVAEQLLSTYASDAGWTDRDGCYHAGIDGVAGFEIEAIEPGAIANSADGQLMIRPVELSKEPGTTQWAFRLRVANA